GPLLRVEQVERNVKRVAERATRLGVARRPHANTHKCVELGRRQLAAGARGLTVSTTVEAEVFARAGVRDLTWAFPIEPGHIPHMRQQAQASGVTVRVVVDDRDTASALAGSGPHVGAKGDWWNQRPR